MSHRRPNFLYSGKYRFPFPMVRLLALIHIRRFAPRAAYAARYARSERSTSNYAERVEVHD